MSRPPSPPPDLPGYTYVRHVGSGGFADVFLYEQTTLHRNVAVKVLLADEADASVLAQFEAESTLMAAMSTHPNIVTIHAASIAADGRPYLVMEYCSRPNLSQRYKAERFSAAETASIGVKLGGAVETAHRAGILHRDIKPANVLTTEHNRPALTDFGISVVAGRASDTVGMSIPWSPPEMLSDEPDGDQRADSYSLAACLYTLLAGRSPYERPGGPNLAADLINRIQRAQLPPIGRSDVPPDLERILATGLAKDPGTRWRSALEMVRALQDVQAAHRWPVTEVDVVDENPVAAQAELDPEDDGRTRIRGFTTIHAQAPAEPTARRATVITAVTDAPAEGTVLRSGGPVPNFLAVDRPPAPVPTDTVLRPQAQAEPVIAQQRARSRWPWLVAAAVAVLVLVGVAVIILTRGSAPAVLPGTQAPTAGPGAGVALGVPAPADLKATREGKDLIFTWKDPDPQPGDSYQWQRTDTDAVQDAQSTTNPSVTIQDSDACISVILVRDNGNFSDPAKLCSKAG